MPAPPDEPSPRAPGPSSVPQPARPPKRDIGHTIHTLATAAVAVLATLLVLANVQTVEVDFIVTSFEAPLSLVIAVSLILGAVIGVGGMGIRNRRRSKTAAARKR